MIEVGDHRIQIIEEDHLGEEDFGGKIMDG